MRRCAVSEGVGVHPGLSVLERAVSDDGVNRPRREPTTTVVQKERPALGGELAHPQPQRLGGGRAEGHAALFAALALSHRDEELPEVDVVAV